MRVENAALVRIHEGYKALARQQTTSLHGYLNRRRQWVACVKLVSLAGEDWVEPTPTTPAKSAAAYKIIPI